MEPEELLGLLDLRYRVVHILLATVTTVVLIWFGYTSKAYYEHLDYENGYDTVELTVIERTEINEGEK